MKTLTQRARSIPGYWFIITAALLWAFDGILRRSLYSLPPTTIVFFEHLIGSILLLFFLPSSVKIKPQLKTWLWLGLVSLLSGVLGTLWFTTALVKTDFISFSVVYLLQKLQPLFAIAAARIMLKEALPKQYLTWASLALLAAYFVTFPTGRVEFAAGSQPAIAALYAFGAAFAWGTSTVFSKLLINEIGSQSATTWRFLLTTVFSLIAVLVMNAVPSMSSISPDQILKLILIALSTGMVALYLYYQGLKSTPAKVSTLLELLFPVTAIIIDGFIYQTWVTPVQIIAAAILLFALSNIQKKV